MQKMIVLFMAIVFGMTGTLSYASAPVTQVDKLIEKLIDKGILSNEEAEALKGEIAYDAKTIQETNMKKDLPDWVQNLKLSGDVRVRVQDERLEGTNIEDRVRGRYRARLNLEAKVNDKAKAVVGIATDGGSNNPRSTNVTFSGSTTGLPNSKPNVVLNKAYGQYSFTPNFTVMGGKMDNPLWEPMEFLMDSDITPEGGAVIYEHKVNDKLSLSTTGLFNMLGELSGSSSDPFMWVGQAMGKYNMTERIDSKLAFYYHGYGNIKSGFSGTGARPTTISATAPVNTAGSGGGNTLRYDYSAPRVAAEIGMNDPLVFLGEDFPIYIPRVGVFGEYTQNPSPKTENKAWMAGAYVGNAKVSGLGTWKLTGAYKAIGKDAFPDILPDSDFFYGGVDVKGFESILEIGLAKNLSFAFDYYGAKRLADSSPKTDMHLWQADINWKF